MNPCPNCGQFAEAGEAHCSQCGASLVPVRADQLLTGSRAFDMILGFLLALVSIWMLVGIILVPMLYSFQKAKYPAFARGLLIGGITMVVLVLGAFLTCVGMIGWFAMHPAQMH